MMWRIRKLFDFSLWRRAVRYWFQRRTKGWDDSVTWNLDRQIAAYMAPRLMRFRDLNNGYPSDMTEDNWNGLIDEMVWAANWYAENAYNHDAGDADMQRALKGLRLVTAHLPSLWW